MTMPLIDQLKADFRRGPIAYIVGNLAFFGYIAAGVWLSIALNFPQSSGATCRRGCVLQSYFYSLDLLSGGWREIALFAWLWTFPAAFALLLIYILLNRHSAN